MVESANQKQKNEIIIPEQNVCGVCVCELFVVSKVFMCGLQFVQTYFIFRKAFK